MSLGSLLVYLGLIIEMVVCGQMGLFAGMSQAQLYEMYALTFALAVLAYWKHRENIVRLIHGNERKTYLTKKNKVDVEESADGSREKSSDSAGKQNPGRTAEK